MFHAGLMKRLIQQVKIITQKLSSSHWYLAIGVIIFVIVSIIIIIQVRSDANTLVAAEKGVQKNIQKKYTDEQFHSNAAKHGRTYKKGIEDPRYPLGHCNPQEAPREMDMKESVQGGWSPC